MRVVETTKGKGISDRLERALRLIGNAILLSMTIAIFMDVVIRTFFHFSVIVISELSTILWVWAVYLLAGVATRNELHLHVDFLSEKYSEKGKRLLKLVGYLLVTGYAAFACWAGIQSVRVHKMLGTVQPTQVAIPEWQQRLVLIPGFALVALWSLDLFIKAVGRKASDVKPGRPESAKAKEG